MSAAEEEGWLQLMFDQQAKLTAAAIAELTKQRALTRDMQSRIDAMPATVWELQERVTQLESLVKAKQ